MLEIAQAEPAKLLLDGDAVQPERTHLGPELARERILRVDPRGDRRDPVGGEALRRLPDHVRILAQREIQLRHYRSSILER